MNLSLDYKLIHYCCGKYPDSFGGVARFDYHVSLAFPNRVWFQGPNQKKQMLEYVKNSDKPVIIMTDNHLACDIPNKYSVILVHHGCAKSTADRNPDWHPYWKKLCTTGQNIMLKYRKPEKTLIVSCSNSCIDDFSEYYDEEYKNFKKILLWHSSELDEKDYKKGFNKKPIILGNWNHMKKGGKYIPALQKLLPEFKFQQLKTSPTRNIKSHNSEKSNIYKSADIFLHLANSEGYGYATIDGFNKNLLICGTNTGILYDIEKEKYDEEVAIIFDWQKASDVNFVAERIKYIWKNRDKYFGRSKEWYDNNVKFEEWKSKIVGIVDEFYKEQYLG